MRLSGDGLIRTGDLLLRKQADCAWLSYIPPRESAQRESNPRFRLGKAVGYHYNMGTPIRSRIVKETESTGWDSNPRRRITGAESSPLNDQCLTIGLGPEGLEPSPTRLRAGRPATRALVPNGANKRRSRPGRS